MDEQGYVHVLGRSDDIINVAAHRLSTGRLEEIISQHTKVAECAVVGLNDELKGSVPVGFVVLKSNVAAGQEQDVARQVALMIRQGTIPLCLLTEFAGVGAIACYKTTLFVPKLPKTRSGKILRRTIRAIANGERYNMPATIDDPTALTPLLNLFSPTSSKL